MRVPDNPYQPPIAAEASQHPKYRTAPAPSDKLPPGIPYIVGNEAAERFSFYGMKGILFVFMTQYLLGRDGQLAVMPDAVATAYFHQFVSAAYFFPILGATLSDTLLGKYRTIIWLSLVYCLGHLALALDETRVGLFVGMVLIAVGSGGIKPCVSAHVGDQFGKQNQHLLEKVFGWFYFSINLGAFVSTLLTPLLLEKVGPWLAFGVPGALMFLATVVFWMGRNKFVHVPAGGWGFVREAFSGTGLKTIGRLSTIYLFIAVFWSLYDQTGSTWVAQAKNMDRTFDLTWCRGWFGIPPTMEVLESQVQAINPVLILLFIPLFAYLIYPAINRVYRLTPLRKIGIGLFITVLSFALSAWIELRISRGERPDVAWQLLSYVIITAAEVMVSITSLEFSYTQAPRKAKSFIMALYLLSVALGNQFTSAVNFFMLNPDGSSRLSGADYYWFFTGVMLAAAVLYIGVAAMYRGETYIQEESTT